MRLTYFNELAMGPDMVVRTSITELVVEVPDNEMPDWPQFFRAQLRPVSCPHGVLCWAVFADNSGNQNLIVYPDEIDSYIELFQAMKAHAA